MNQSVGPRRALDSFSRNKRSKLTRALGRDPPARVSAKLPPWKAIEENALSEQASLSTRTYWTHECESQIYPTDNRNATAGCTELQGTWCGQVIPVAIWRLTYPPAERFTGCKDSARTCNRYRTARHRRAVSFSVGARALRHHVILHRRKFSHGSPRVPHGFMNKISPVSHPRVM